MENERIKVMGVGSDSINVVNKIKDLGIDNIKYITKKEKMVDTDLLLIIGNIDIETSQEIIEIVNSAKEQNISTILIGPKKEEKVTEFNVDSVIVVSEEDVESKIIMVVRTISDLFVDPKFDNDDFKNILTGTKCLFADVGVAKGTNRVTNATNMVMTSSFLNQVIKDTSNIIINVTGDNSLNLLEVEEAYTVAKEIIKEDTNVIYVCTVNEKLTDEVVVTILAAED